MIISEEAADMVQATARLLVKAIRVKGHVLEPQDLDLKAVRCHYTDAFPKEVLQIEIQKKSWELT